MWDVSPSLALNLVLRYSSPGNLAFFLLREALGQPERLGPNTINSLFHTKKHNIALLHEQSHNDSDLASNLKPKGRVCNFCAI